MKCKKCKSKLFFRCQAKGYIEIVCPKCGIRAEGKVKSKDLLQDVKLKDCEVEI